MRFYALSFALLFTLTAGQVALAQTATPAAEASSVPAIFSTEAKGFIETFCGQLPAAEGAQNAVLRGLATRDGVRSKPTFPANGLLKWLDERAQAAQTATQKRETIQDFLLAARPLVREPKKSERRRGLRSALKAIEVAGDDIGLRADIAGAFLAPYVRDSDASGPFSAAALLDDLWPRYGRIITLEVQNGADIEAMQKAAQTGKSDVPPLQIGSSSPLTVPFLQILATVPGPREGWATYRLARLYREQKNTEQARFWFGRLSFGDGAGIFKRLLPLYDAGAPSLDTQQSAKDTTPLSEFALHAWENVKRLLPDDVPGAQANFIAELRKRAATADEKRAPIYTTWADQLEEARSQPGMAADDLKAHRTLVLKAEEAIRVAFMALLKADGAQNIYFFHAHDDWQLLAEAELLFKMSHFEALSAINYNSNSRYDTVKSAAARLVGAEDGARALPMLELWSAICYPGNHYGQALDEARRVLEANGRLEDALLCLEAIPSDSGMGGGLVWSAPAIRKKWSELVKAADKTALVYERETPLPEDDTNKKE